MFLSGFVIYGMLLCVFRRDRRREAFDSVVLLLLCHCFLLVLSLIAAFVVGVNAFFAR